MKLLLNILGVILVIQLISCKEDKDEVPPIIAFTSPTENSSYNVLDEVAIEANITDNEAIKSVVVRLISEETGNAVLSTRSFLPGSRSFDLNFAYSLSDSLLEGGTYYFQIEARDEENSTSAFKFIRLSGITKRKLGVFVACSDGVATNIYKDDNDFNFSLFQSINSSYFNSYINSYDQLYWYLPEDDNEWSVYNLIDDQLLSSRVYNSPFSQTFTALVGDNRDVFIGIKSGEIDGFNQVIEDNYTFSTVGNQQIGAIGVGERYILAEELNSNSTPSSVLILRKSSGTLISSFNLSDDIVGMYFFEDDRAIVFMNNQNGSKIARLEVNGTFSVVQTNSSTIQRVIQISVNEYLLSMDNDIQQYKVANNNLVTYSTVKGSVLAYDKLLDQLYIGIGNRLEVYQYFQNGMIRSRTFAEEVQGVNIRYNKN